MIADIWSTTGGLTSLVALGVTVVVLKYGRDTVTVARETVTVARRTLDEETKQRRLAQLERMLEHLAALGSVAEKLGQSYQLPGEWESVQRRLRMSLAIWTSLGGDTLVVCDEVNDMRSEHPPHEEKKAKIREAIEEVLDTLGEQG